MYDPPGSRVDADQVAAFNQIVPRLAVTSMSKQTGFSPPDSISGPLPEASTPS
jgi:hypothetical protein